MNILENVIKIKNEVTGVIQNSRGLLQILFIFVLLA